MTDPTIVDTESGPTLIIETAPNCMAAVPLEAVASWGELLGLSDTDALAAILAGASPSKDLDVEGGNGWTGLYDNLADAGRTRQEVATATAQHVRTDGVSLVNSAVLSALGKFGPTLILDQADALVEDRQRTTRTAMPAPPLATTLGDLLTRHASTLSERRQAFLINLSPAPNPKATS